MGRGEYLSEDMSNSDSLAEEEADPEAELERVEDDDFEEGEIRDD